MNVTIFENAYSQRVEKVQQPEEINVFVASALRFVLQNVFINITNTFTATISFAEGRAAFWLLDIMNKLFTTFGLMALNLVVLDKKRTRLHLPGKHYCNLIMVDSFASLEKADIAEYNRASDSLEYYFIFLQVRDIRAMQEMELIFKYCFDNYWLHCNVMIQNAKSEIYIYSYFPFQDGHCFATNPILINQFIGDRFVNTTMFPDKLQNLHMCPFSLSTWDVPPFVIDFQRYKYPIRRISGIEMIIVNAIARDMNFTIDIHLIDITRYSIKYSTSSEGPLKYLRDRETNISMGYFRRTIERDQIGTPSFVTYYLPLVAIVLRKQHQSESMGILTIPFDIYTWFLLFITYCSLVLINYLQRKKNKLNSFQILEVLIGMPANRVPNDFSRRLRFFIWLLSAFVLRSIYQSLLFSLFRARFYISPPPTLDGLTATGYTTVCTQLSEPFVQYVPQIVDETLPLVSLNSSNELDPLRYLESHPGENFAAITILDFAYYYVATEMHYDNALQVLPINVNDQQIGLYFTKHSYLINRFDDYILRFHSAGLLKKWREWTIFRNVVTFRSDKTGRNARELMISLKQLLGFFIVSSLLLVLACVFFMLELLSKKVVSLQKFFFFINGRNKIISKKGTMDQ